MIHTTHNELTTNSPLSTLTLGRYRIAACPRALPDGRFAAQVAISSGQGSASTARLMRFADAFASHEDAVQYGQAQGLSWVAERQGTPTTPLAMPQPSLAIQAILI